MSSESVIKIDNVSVHYGKAIAVDGVSLSVAQGSVYALLGRNGAGKTSLVRCILGQQKPNQGRVTIFGRNVWTDRAPLMSRVGVVPEDPDAPPEMTAAFLGQLLECPDCRAAILAACNSEDRDAVDIDETLRMLALRGDH